MAVAAVEVTELADVDLEDCWCRAGQSWERSCASDFLGEWGDGGCGFVEHLEVEVLVGD